MGNIVNFRTGTVHSFSGEYFRGLSQYRHRVFVEMLGWELQCEHGIETDQFDRDDTIYVVAHDAASEIIGLGRLLPTTRPYLLGEVFPELLNGNTPPSSPDVWELSRFAAVDFNAEATSAMGQFSSEIAIELLHQSIETARAHGAKELITVSPLGIERLLRRSGFKAHRAGPPKMCGRHAVFANVIDCMA
jgi:acyl homoserine lactone synthase